MVMVCFSRRQSRWWLLFLYERWELLIVLLSLTWWWNNSTALHHDVRWHLSVLILVWIFSLIIYRLSRGPLCTWIDRPIRWLLELKRSFLSWWRHSLNIDTLLNNQWISCLRVPPPAITFSYNIRVIHFLEHLLLNLISSMLVSKRSV